MILSELQNHPRCTATRVVLPAKISLVVMQKRCSRKTIWPGSWNESNGVSEEMNRSYKTIELKCLNNWVEVLVRLNSNDNQAAFVFQKRSSASFRQTEHFSLQSDWNCKTIKPERHNLPTDDAEKTNFSVLRSGWRRNETEWNSDARLLILQRKLTNFIQSLNWSYKLFRLKFLSQNDFFVSFARWRFNREYAAPQNVMTWTMGWRRYCKKMAALVS